jgi:hypothetical protein
VAAARDGASPAAWESPTGNAAPDLPCLTGQPVAPAIIHARCASGPQPTLRGHRGPGSPCPPHGPQTGEPHSADGPRSARPLPRSPGVCQAAPGSLLSGGKAPWGRREGATLPAHSRPAGRVGRGRVVGARASRVHGEVSPGRRSLACGKTGTTVPSARASGPRGAPWRLGQGAGTRHGVWPWRRTAGAEPCEVKASSTVLNGGMRKRPVRQRASSLPNCLAPAFGGGSCLALI